MTPDDFKKEMKRLEEVFLSKNYPVERVRLIWLEVKKHDHYSWNETVNRLISTRRTPPMLPEIREEIENIRIERHNRAKALHRQDAQDFYDERFFTDEQTKWVIKVTMMRMRGLIKDDEWYEFRKQITMLAGS